MSEADAVPRHHDPVRWVEEHVGAAADEVIAFFAGDGLSLEGKDVADIGCGDGLIDLGLVLKAKPRSLTGFDIRPTDETALLRSARAADVAQELPENLQFSESAPTQLPAETASFDIVVSWSVLEHVDNPVGLLGEVRRVLRPDGVFFLQVWPLFHSEHGGHLWLSYEDPFVHLLRRHDEILEQLHGKPATDPTRAADDEFRSLNRITLDQLQRALLASNLVPTKLKLLSSTVHIPVELSHISFADIAVGGIQLLAVPR